MVVHDLRDCTHDRHRTVDDTPYGGGPGMVMRPEPWGAALDAVAALSDAASPDRRSWSCRPRPGSRSPRRMAERVGHRAVAASSRAAATRGSTTGWSRTRAAAMPVVEVSLGDYVLNGGEVAALAMVEAVARLLPGCVGNAESLAEESHADGLLEAPGLHQAGRSGAATTCRRCCSPGTTRQIARWRRDAVAAAHRAGAART